MTLRCCTVLTTVTLLLSCAALLAACVAGPKPGPLHALRSVAQPQAATGFTDFGGMILIMPVRLAPQIQSRSLLIRNEAGETTASLSHRWAGPLDEQIAETLAGNLRALLGTDHVAIAPGPRYGIPHYQLEVEISEFDSDAKGFTLQATYTLADALRKTMLRRTSFNTTRVLDKPGFSGYVEAASEAVAELSAAAAKALIAARQSQPTPPQRP